MSEETTDRGAIEEIGKAAELIQQVAKPVLNLIFTVIPIIINFTSATYKFYKKLPIVVVRLIIGFIMCFFGGMFPTVFAAIEVSILSAADTSELHGVLKSYYTHLSGRRICWTHNSYESCLGSKRGSNDHH